MSDLFFGTLWVTLVLETKWIWLVLFDSEEQPLYPCLVSGSIKFPVEWLIGCWMLIVPFPPDQADAVGDEFCWSAGVFHVKIRLHHVASFAAEEARVDRVQSGRRGLWMSTLVCAVVSRWWISSVVVCRGLTVSASSLLQSPLPDCGTLPQNVTLAPSQTISRKRQKTPSFLSFHPQSPVVPAQWLCHLDSIGNRYFFSLTISPLS